MRIKNLAIVALTLMALVSATSAFATVACGPNLQSNPGEVGQQVTSSDVGGFTNVAVGTLVGGVTVDLNNCIVGATICTWIATGIPGGPLPQSATVGFLDADGPPPVPCTVTDADGLPVELVEFSVE